MHHFDLGWVNGAALKTVAFVFLLGVLVIIHEYGHYIMSKRAKIPVEEFAIGFGPVVCKLFQSNETTFNLRALPLGGFVRTVGMDPGDEDPRGYNQQRVWTRTKIIAAGPIINLVFGFLLIVTLGMTVGLPRTEPAVGDVTVGDVTPNSVAQKAGLQKGDQLVALNGHPVLDITKTTDEIHGSPNKRITLGIVRHGQNLTIAATPKPTEENHKTIGLLGFQVMNNPKWQRHGLADSIAEGAKESTQLVKTILKGVFSKRTWSHREFGGPIAIAEASGGAAEQGLKNYLQFMAMFSINLGVMNLLPLPVLDGGHLLLLAIEGTRRRRLSTKAVMTFQSVGFAMLMLFFLFIMASDLQHVFQHG